MRFHCVSPVLGGLHVVATLCVFPQINNIEKSRIRETVSFVI